MVAFSEEGSSEQPSTRSSRRSSRRRKQVGVCSDPVLAGAKVPVPLHTPHSILTASFSSVNPSPTTPPQRPLSRPAASLPHQASQQHARKHTSKTRRATLAPYQLPLPPHHHTQTLVSSLCCVLCLCACANYSSLCYVFTHTCTVLVPHVLTHTHTHSAAACIASPCLSTHTQVDYAEDALALELEEGLVAPPPSVNWYSSVVDAGGTQRYADAASCCWVTTAG